MSFFDTAILIRWELTTKRVSHLPVTIHTWSIHHNYCRVLELKKWSLETVARSNKPRTKRENSSDWSDWKNLRRFVEIGVTGDRKNEEWMSVRAEQTRSCPKSCSTILPSWDARSRECTHSWYRLVVSYGKMKLISESCDRHEESCDWWNCEQRKESEPPRR